MDSARRLHHTYVEYLQALEISGVKLEYCGGEIYAMAGGTPEHAELAASVLRLLGNSLVGRCRVFSSDLKIRIEATDLTTFPDGAVVCGAPVSPPNDRLALTNPTILVEVTSPSSEDYDRGEKLRHYQQIPDLRAVIIVSHRQRRVSVVARTAAGWSVVDYGTGETAVLVDPDVHIRVDELYASVLS